MFVLDQTSGGGNTSAVAAEATEELAVLGVDGSTYLLQ
jgi:hypothetical protein